MSANALAEMDANAAVQAQILSESEAQNPKEIKSMDHHRQMLQAKLAADQYVPSTTVKASSLTVYLGVSKTTSPRPTTS